MATTKALELAQFGSDLLVDEDNDSAVYNGTLGSTNFSGLPSVLIVFGRTSSTNISISNGLLAVDARAGNITVGIN